MYRRHLAAALALLAALATLPALAAGEDLDACRWQSGQPIEPKVCDKLRQLAERDQARTQQQQAQQARHLQFEAQMQAEAASAAQESRRRDAEDRAREQANRDWMAEQADKAERNAQAIQRQHQARMARLRKECGADFQNPRVGMSFERARQCVGDLKLYAENGAARTYRAGRLHLTVVGGVVTRWIVF